MQAASKGGRETYTQITLYNVYVSECVCVVQTRLLFDSFRMRPVDQKK